MTLYYGINRGDNEYEAALSSVSSTSKEVEIVVNDTNVPGRDDLLEALENLRNFILRNNYPPA